MSERERNRKWLKTFKCDFLKMALNSTQTTREIVIDLERDGPQTPWGIRLVGGSDMNLPLIITQVHMLYKQ